MKSISELFRNPMFWGICSICFFGILERLFKDKVKKIHDENEKYKKDVKNYWNRKKEENEEEEK